eukprot:36096-Eustigmatos_ZCMA.PRE.1
MTMRMLTQVRAPPFTLKNDAAVHRPNECRVTVSTRILEWLACCPLVDTRLTMVDVRLLLLAQV